MRSSTLVDDRRCHFEMISWKHVDDYRCKAYGESNLGTTNKGNNSGPNGPFHIPGQGPRLDNGYPWNHMIIVKTKKNRKG